MNKKALTAIAVCVAFFSGFFVCALGSRGAIIQDVIAKINIDMSMKMHNQDFTPTDTDGSEIRPLIYNDRSYLPVRAISEALNLAVDYDANTQTIYLGEREWTPLTKTLVSNTAYASYTTDKDLLSAGGKTFTEGLSMLPNHSVYLSSAIIQTNNKFQKIKGTAVYDKKGSAENSITLEFRSDNGSGTLYKSLTLTDGHAVDFEVDIQGCGRLYIKSGFSSKGKISIGDIKLK